MELFFGTNNVHKLKEIQEILGNEVKVLSFKDVAPIEVEETEPTLEGNAILKARAFYEHTGIACFADDTGLGVEALNGAPGVISARYAGEQCNPKDNMALLLNNLQGVANRKAQFRTVIAYFDGNKIQLFEGIVEGVIGTEPKGEGGFGYDPIFTPDGYTQTFAELPSSEKHNISHRGKAVRAFAAFIKEIG